MAKLSSYSTMGVRAFLPMFDPLGQIIALLSWKRNPGLTASELNIGPGNLTFKEE
jgi:hypothetical protein